MNGLAAYNSLPDLNTTIIRPDHSTIADNASSAFGNKTKSLIPVSVETSLGQGRKYNYYVLDDKQEIIYNTKKNTEKINHYSLGTIINIFA